MLNITKAHQILPLMLKVYDCVPVEDRDEVLTLERDGVEEFLVPNGEVWTYLGDNIDQINLEVDEDDKTIRMVIITNIDNDEFYVCELNEEISLDDLVRYKQTPFEFDEELEL